MPEAWNSSSGTRGLEVRCRTSAFVSSTRLGPQVHSARQSQPNVLAPTNARRFLEHDGNKNKWAFRVPFPCPDLGQIVCENGQEALPNSTLRYCKAGRRNLDHAAVPGLPKAVPGNAAVEVGAIIVVRMVPKDNV